MGVDYDEVIYPDKEGDETWTQAKPKLGMDCPNVSQHFVKNKRNTHPYRLWRCIRQ